MSVICPMGHENQDGADYCMSCGARLVRVCAKGHENASAARFCRVCGAALVGTEQGTREHGPGAAKGDEAGVAAGTLATPVTEVPSLQAPTVAPSRTVGPERAVRTANGRGRPSTSIVAISLLAILAAGGGVAAALVAMGDGRGRHAHAPPPTSSRSGPTGVTGVTGPTGATGPSGATGATQLTPQSSADKLASMLASSVQDRSAIVTAVSDVSNCGPNLSSDASIFESAVASRLTLLGQLHQLQVDSPLSQPMLAYLAGAWRASVAADRDFSKWAQDEESGGCTPGASDPYLSAASGPDAQATIDKQAFVNDWNNIGPNYGEPTYSWQQL